MAKKKFFGFKQLMTILMYLIISFVVVVFALSWLSSQDSLSFRTFVIQSGSMEPSIMTGDIIVIKPEVEYVPPDVITYLDESDRVVTHRILQVKNDDDQVMYETKGDANQSPDSHPIPYDQVMGKVNFVIPKLGFAVAFAQSRHGMILLILVPVVLIIYDELRKIFVEVKK